MLDQVLAGGYRGRIYPVNPRGGELRGLPVYRSVADIPETVDLAVISTPRTVVPEIVEECAKRGIKAIVVITQGFADASDADGPRLQEEMVRRLAGTGARLIGPNTIGVINLYERVNTSFIGFERVPADTAMICQSGIFLLAAAEFTCGLGLGVDIGNAADVDFNQALQTLGEDGRVRVINLHMEGIRDGRRFMAVAGRVSRHKPLLCLKTGRSEAGARAAGSHSGSLAGEDHVFSAAFRQCGVLRVRDVEEMHYLNKTFLTYPAIPGRRLAVITISGGAGIAAVDACADYGLEVAAFSRETKEKLAAVFPAWMEVGNPADIWPAGMSRGYLEVLELALDAALADPQVDAVLAVSPAYLKPEDDPRLDISAAVNRAAARRPDKPLAVWIFGAHRGELAARVEEAGRVVVYPSPERAVASLAALYRYYHEIKTAPVPVPDARPVPDSAPVERILAAARRAGRTDLHTEALEVLRACGIPVLPWQHAADAAQAVRAAEQLGYPVVMKIDSPEISHKSDVGGVMVDLADAAAVTAAYDEMMRTVKKRAPRAPISGVIIQPYRPGGVEIILGAKRDPSFGPVLVYGLGGIYTELFRDVSFRIAPITREEALQMIRETRSCRLLGGFRGRPAADLDALAELVVRLGQLVIACPEIAEMDINPLLVGPHGAVAVDARITIAGALTPA